MKKVELMKVESTYELEDVGLLLMPLFVVPDIMEWENIRDSLTIQTPDNEALISSGLFELTQVTILQPDGPDIEQWKIRLVLENVDAESVPVDSIVYGKQATKNYLIGD